MYKDKRVEKKKTVVMKRCLNPVFNESFAFDIPTERLRETTIVITVMDKDRLSRNDVIGKVGPMAAGWGGGCPAMMSYTRVAVGGQPGPCLVVSTQAEEEGGVWWGSLVLALHGHLWAWPWCVVARTHLA